MVIHQKLSKILAKDGGAPESFHCFALSKCILVSREHSVAQLPIVVPLLAQLYPQQSFPWIVAHQQLSKDPNSGVDSQTVTWGFMFCKCA